MKISKMALANSEWPMHKSLGLTFFFSTKPANVLKPTNIIWCKSGDVHMAEDLKGHNSKRGTVCTGRIHWLPGNEKQLIPLLPIVQIIYLEKRTVPSPLLPVLSISQIFRSRNLVQSDPYQMVMCPHVFYGWTLLGYISKIILKCPSAHKLCPHECIPRDSLCCIY